MAEQKSKIENVQEAVVNRLHGDKVLWVIVFLLSLISIALIYSASSSLAYKQHTTNFGILLKHLRFIVFGIVALYTCYKIPPKWYRMFSFPLFAFSIMLLVVTLLIGEKTNDAQRWLVIGGIKFQPAEFAKIAMVLYLARALEILKIDTYKSFLIKIIAPIAVACILIMVGSISAALYMGLISFIILFLAGIKHSYLLKTIGLGAAGLVLLFVLHLASKPLTGENRGIFPRFDTAVERIKRHVTKSDAIDETATLSKREQQKIADESLQADMAQIAVKEGGLIGKGPGNSIQRHVLPHPYSDYVYAIIIEEYGMFGGLFVLMLYIWFFYRCVGIVKGCKTVFSAVTVGGLGTVIMVQAMLHILVNVGIFPVTGHTLPLVSLGGTSFVVVSSAIGIILSISRTKDDALAALEESRRLEKEQQKEERRREREAEKEIVAQESESSAENSIESYTDYTESYTETE